MTQHRAPVATKTRKHQNDLFCFVRSRFRGVHLPAIVVLTCVTLTAQPPPGLQGRGRGGPPPSRPEALAIADHSGFTSIFDGSSMNGWDGDPAFWRIANGALTGQSSIENPVKQNTFIMPATPERR